MSITYIKHIIQTNNDSKVLQLLLYILDIV